MRTGRIVAVIFLVGSLRAGTAGGEASAATDAQQLPAYAREFDGALPHPLLQTADGTRSIGDAVGPYLEWSSFLGGSGADFPWAVATDLDGNALITGYSGSADFRGVAADPPYSGGYWCAFVAKVSPSGHLLWATFLGGSSTSYGLGIAADLAGNAFVTGYTNSPDFPTPGGFDTTFSGGSWDAFVAKLTPSGELAWASFLGGSGTDQAWGIAADLAGDAVIVGTTSSGDFPVTGGAGTSYSGGAGDAFAAKVTADCQVQWARFIGGGGTDLAYGVDTDAAGSAFVTGATSSAVFPSGGGSGASRSGGYDAYAVKINLAGELEWARLLGGSGDDQGWGVAADPDGNVLLTGRTASPDFPTTGGFDSDYNGGESDAFAAKLSGSGDLAWAGFLGGSGADYGWSIAADAAGNALIAGTASSADFPSIGGLGAGLGGERDAFAAKVGPFGALQWAACLGGSGSDYGWAIAADAAGDLFVSGYTDSTDLPGAGPGSAIGGGDAFLAKVKMLPDLVVQSTPVSGASITGEAPGTTDYVATPGIGDTVDLWAPERIVVGGADFRFVRWKLDGADGQSREKHLQVTMNTPHAAIGIYRLVADMNGDCVVNILDLIIARNRLLQDVNSGENWLADVDDNGRINVLDMILIRNRLGNKCM